MEGQQYTKNVDYFSLGCLTYYLLTRSVLCNERDILPAEEILKNVLDQDAADFIVYLAQKHEHIQDVTSKHQTKLVILVK